MDHVDTIMALKNVQVYVYFFLQVFFFNQEKQIWEFNLKGFMHMQTLFFLIWKIILVHDNNSDTWESFKMKNSLLVSFNSQDNFPL